jgi:predicted aconitase with swiveling domain
MAPFKGKAVMDASLTGRGVYVESISFYGDVDPSTGRLVDGRSIAGRILVAWKSKGSTVGPYVMYSLRKRGKQPLAILLGIADPIIIAGSVIAEIPLVHRLPREFFERVSKAREPLLRVQGDLVELVE